MTTLLFLDDNQERQKKIKERLPSIIQTYTAAETIETIEEVESIDVLFLDHDLGGEVYVDSQREDCGMEVARWLVKNPQNINTIVLHSFNPIGKHNMYLALSPIYNTVTASFGGMAFNSVIDDIIDNMDNE